VFEENENWYLVKRMFTRVDIENRTGLKSNSK